MSDTMAKAAWAHGHVSTRSFPLGSPNQGLTLSQGKQILLDGTFGVAKERMLLFVVMAVDSRGKALPIGLFL